MEAVKKAGAWSQRQSGMRRCETAEGDILSI